MIKEKTVRTFWKNAPAYVDAYGRLAGRNRPVARSTHSRIFGFRLPPAMTSCRDGRAKRDGGLKTAIQVAVVCAGGDAAGPRVGRSLDERRGAPRPGLARSQQPSSNEWVKPAVTRSPSGVVNQGWREACLDSPSQPPPRALISATSATRRSPRSWTTVRSFASAALCAVATSR